MTENINEIDSKILNNILSDFQKVSKNLNFASKKIIKNKFSRYPIFIISKNDINVGSLLFDHNEINNNNWKYYATYYENIVENKLIENQDKFLKNFKNPDKFCCIIYLDNKNSKFIFVPYQGDKL